MRYSGTNLNTLSRRQPASILSICTVQNAGDRKRIIVSEDCPMLSGVGLSLYGG